MTAPDTTAGALPSIPARRGFAEVLARPRVLLGAWAIAAATFASLRVPYDDEWFQITLARDTTWGAFWQSLRGDVHPPWIALVDRATVHLAGAAAMPLTRVVASLLALALIQRVVTEQTRIAPVVVALAAFHPIVFMYGGAARWYPFALLGDALRAHALFGPRAGSRKAMGVFLLGTLVGAASGYAELGLVALDVGWLLALSHTRGRVRASVATAIVASAIAGALVVGSPLFTSHFGLFAHGIGGGWSSTGGWLALGLVGEAWLP